MPTNRLAGQTSPYLLQHAKNPVAWHPWGEEAFAEARRREVPIFLSIGYSTCYWCHVMERESFESESIARIMNEKFVCIKVDREERPDVDDLYMTATQLMTGHGGWPMSVFLEPKELKPFWCGTYFPDTPRPNMGVPSFPQVLEALAAAWTQQRDEVLQQAEQIAADVRERLGSRPAVAPGTSPLGLATLTDSAAGLLRMLDQNHGGFGSAPKFPQPVFLDFLLDLRSRAANPETQIAVDRALKLTLDKMMIGGLHDQVGGGFHRYCVDAIWLVPHFEKMLYDNAQLARTYAHAATVYNDEEYARVVRRTISSVLRDMSVAGLGAFGFASAIDAEVQTKEGLNYLWTPHEIRAALSPEEAQVALALYGLDMGPNFRDPHHPSEPARNVLRLSDRLDRLAVERGLTPAALRQQLDAVNAKLLQARNARPQPHTDDKVLAGWNGLMISACAAGFLATGETSMLDAAERCAAFILRDMISREQGLVLARSWRAGKAGGPGFLEDYAFVAEGFLALARACENTDEGKPRARAYRDTARRIVASARAQFRGDQGAWYETRADQNDLFVRARGTHDGALPGGASTMLHVLLDLHESGSQDRAQNSPHLEDALALLADLSPVLAEHPVGSINAVRALLRLMTTPTLAQHAEQALGLSKSAPQAPQARAADDFTPVEIYAGVERLTVTADTPAELTLVIRIAEGYHIVAADHPNHHLKDHPKSSGSDPTALAALRVHTVGGTGLAAYADYPPGIEYTPPGLDDNSATQQPHRIYQGTLELRVAVEHTGERTGRPLLAVTYQACSDHACLRPRTVEIDVPID